MAFYVAFLPLYLLRIVNENTMKRAFLCYLWGMKRETLDGHARDFAKEVITTWGYEKMLSELSALIKGGTDVWLVTASPDFYGNAIGRHLGIDRILATTVNYGDRMPLMPDLPYGNNKGETKVKRLREKEVVPLVGRLVDSAAYSDSTADLPMLAVTKENILVNPNDRLIASVSAEEVRIERFQRPWKTKWKKAYSVVTYLLGLRKV